MSRGHGDQATLDPLPRAVVTATDVRAVSRGTLPYAFGAGLVSLGLLAVFIYGSPVPQLVFGHDLIILLDGAWKWNSGIVPHVDYYSPLGFLTFALVGWGAKITGNLATAVPAAMCLFAVVALPICCYLTFTRMPPWLAAFATIMLLAIGIAVHQVKFESSALTYCTIYNRWGYLLFCIALLTVTLPPFSRAPRFEVIDGVIAASCVVLAIAIKITFGVLALLLLVSWICVAPRTRVFYVAALGSACLWVLLAGMALQWHFSSFVGDIILAFRARQGLGLAEAIATARYLYPDLTVVSGLAGCWFVTGLLRRDVTTLARAWQAVLTLACFALSAVAIVMSNAPNGFMRESPVLAVGAVILLAAILRDLECVRRQKATDPAASSMLRLMSGLLALALIVFALVARWQSAGSGTILILAAIAALWSIAELAGERGARRSFSWMKAFGCVGVILVVGPVMLRNLDSLRVAAQRKLDGQNLTAAETFQRGGLAGIQIKAWGGDPALPTTYVGKVQDGLELLAATGNAQRTVHALEFSNPFNVARLIAPSRTAPTCWQLDFVYSSSLAPPVERVFTPGEVVMLPKLFGDARQENLTVLLSHYGSYLAANYHPPVESEQWTLYAPKGL